MLIKTIWSKDAANFDDMVNEALNEGYVIKVRDVREILKDVRGFYAELEKREDVPVDETVAAIRTIRAFCAEQNSCQDCPLDGFNTCDHMEPERWILPVEGE